MSSAPSTECRSHTEKRVPTNVLKTRAELHEPDTQEQGQTHKTQGIIAFLWKVLKKGTYKDNTPCWLPGVAEVLLFFCSQTWSRKIPHTVQQLSPQLSPQLPQLLSLCSRTQEPQQEKPPRWEACTLQLQKGLNSNEGPTQPKLNLKKHGQLYGDHHEVQGGIFPEARIKGRSRAEKREPPQQWLLYLLPRLGNGTALNSSPSEPPS